MCSPLDVLLLAVPLRCQNTDCSSFGRTVNFLLITPNEYTTLSQTFGELQDHYC